MRYLKTFESKVEEDSIRKFCEDNLAYLIDAGFEIDVTENKDNKGELTNEYEIFIEKSSTSDKGFKWADLKYDFIPFLELLSMKYEIINGMCGGRLESSDNIKDFKFVQKGYDSYYFTKEMILNDELETTTWLEYVKERGDNPGEYDKSDEAFLSTYQWRSINFYIKEI